MHISNPLEAKCRLRPQRLPNGLGALLSDASKSRFMLTVGKEEMPDLIVELVACYRDCADTDAMASLLGRIATESQSRETATP